MFASERSNVYKKNFTPKNCQLQTFLSLRTLLLAYSKLVWSPWTLTLTHAFLECNSCLCICSVKLEARILNFSLLSSILASMIEVRLRSFWSQFWFNFSSAAWLIFNSWWLVWLGMEFSVCWTKWRSLVVLLTWPSISMIWDPNWAKSFLISLISLGMVLSLGASDKLGKMLVIEVFKAMIWLVRTSMVTRIEVRLSWRMDWFLANEVNWWPNCSCPFSKADLSSKTEKVLKI